MSSLSADLPGKVRGSAARRLRLARLGVWSLGLFPLFLTIVEAVNGDLGANPIEALTHRTGFWALTLLLASLAITPIRRITGWNRLIQLRRPLGLFAFFYAGLHLLVYAALDHGLALDHLLSDVVERPFITAGTAAFLLLVPLALTSTRAMMRRLGRRWQPLHRLVYLSAALAVLHFVWLVKADLTRPLLFAGVLTLLLLLRLPLRRSGGSAGS